MTTAQSNRPDPFEVSSGFSAEEAERLAAAFRPSWEFDDAPFTHAQGDAGELDRLSAGGVNGDIRGRTQPMAMPMGTLDDRGESHAKSAAAHAPPARVETHEPDVSVIIDRSITVSESPHAPPPAPAPVIQAAPVLAPPMPPSGRTAANPSTTAKRAQRRDASESLEIPKSLRSSNKGLFIGIGVAAAAAVAVLAIRAATASSDAPGATISSTPPTSTAAPTTSPIPPIPTTPPSTVATAYSPSPAAQARNVPAPQVAAPPPHRAAPPPPAPHHAASKSPPKAAGGGIVRDVPF